MGHMALYRQFRPVTFDEIVEQKHAVTALRQSVISGQVGHAYLFCGTRGTGKTTIAKIFSRAINCLAPINGNPCNECEICRGILDNTLMDVIEMDAASNNSVDNIRRICDEVMFLPSRTKYKVYIIDEVHMLSGGAFNALLKTLEEPPAHAVFLLATTEPHRIPATIISRCQRYDFRRIPMESMVLRLQVIADAQQITIDHDALVTISNLSDGALRDAISLLDQVSTGVSRRITRDDVLRITGVVDDAFLYSMADALLSGNAPAIVTLTEQLVMDGRDMIRFTLDLAHYFRDLMVIRVTPDPEILVQATSASMAQMQEIAARTESETLVFAVTRLSGLVSELKWSPDMRTSFEIALLSFGASGHNPASASGSSKTPSRAAVPAPVAVAPAIASAAVPVISVETDMPAAYAAPVKPAEPAVPTAPAAFAAPTEPVVSGAPVVPAVFAAPAAVQFIKPAATAPEKTSAEAHSPKGRAYMAPPPIDDMFSSSPVPGEAAVSLLRRNTSLSPMEATLEAPPEEESYLPPPSFDREAPDSAALQKPLPKISLVPDTLPDTFPDTLPDTLPDMQPDPNQLSMLDNQAPDPWTIATSNHSDLPLAELWAALLHKWEETLFSDALQLKQVSIYQKDQVFYIVFPDHMQAYAKSLTARADYKKIVKDIFTLVPGAASVEIQTESEKNGLINTNGTVSPADKASKQPEWVAQMLAFSEATGIPVETLDNL